MQASPEAVGAKNKVGDLPPIVPTRQDRNCRSPNRKKEQILSYLADYQHLDPSLVKEILEACKIELEANFGGKRALAPYGMTLLYRV